MARIRSCHPGQWTDDAFVSCSHLARLLVLGLRNEADDNGIFEWNPTKLKMRLLPADNADIPALLAELSGTDQVMRYTVKGREFGIIRSFTRFQKPKKPSFQHPTPPEPLPLGYELSPAYSPTSSPPVPHQTGTQPPDGEGVGEGGKAKPPGKSAASRVPTPPAPEPSPRCASLRSICDANRVVLNARGRMHLGQWADEGLADAQFLQAIAIARDRKPHPELIPCTYLVPIVTEVRAGTAKSPALDPAEAKRQFIAAGTAEILRTAGEGWWDDPEKIAHRAAEEGVIVIPNQSFEDFTARVLAASGPGPWLEAQEPDMRARIDSWLANGINPSQQRQQGRQPVPAGAST